MGLSLSDSYWICPTHAELRWSEVNHYSNTFSEDIGDVLIGKVSHSDVVFDSPDCSLEGCLKKRWMVIDGKRVLVKGGSRPYRQEPYNEAIASRIAGILGIPCITYSLYEKNHEHYCLCDDFTNENLEFIPMWQLLKANPRIPRESNFDYVLRVCEEFGISDSRIFLERMVVFDFLIANEDRHLRNFGVLRNPDTLEPIGMAPLFDNGSCLGFNTPSSIIGDEWDLQCKPFKMTHSEQIKLISSFDWLNLDSLMDVSSFIEEILSDAHPLIDTYRAMMISQYFMKRVSKLKSYLESGPLREDDLSTDLRFNLG